MGLKANFSLSDIRKALDIEKVKLKKGVVSVLSKAGKKFVELAWSKTSSDGGFNDITGDLRSSIAYAIIYQGDIIESSYSKGGTKNGKNKARSFINELKDGYTEGYVLIVVAGMEYASAVESRGKDVISGSSLIIKELLRNSINSLKS